jgi:UDP-galactopyranose mutase
VRNPYPLPDLVCLSHLRWNFVFQRPQHLMVRFARDRRVFFVEEPIYDADAPRLEIHVSHAVTVVVPHLPPTANGDALDQQRALIRGLFVSRQIRTPLLWLYTPLAWPIVEGVPASAVVYDCMDDLSGFAGASPELCDRERALLAEADVVFTGGYSLFEAKCSAHANVHAMPSSVDVSHFERARTWRLQPADQRAIASPRIGFCGVIDERMNLDLVRDVAAARPEWQVVMIGPVVKISEASLPRAANIHYLGMKPYAQLPAYFAGWSAAMLPFAHNAATRYISPTKTPEYLAAGCPVVSTSIRDVVRPYGEGGMAGIADSPAEFVEALELALTPAGREQVARADALLRTMSWDRTWTRMHALVLAAEGATPDAADPPRAPMAALGTGAAPI